MSHLMLAMKLIEQTGFGEMLRTSLTNQLSALKRHGVTEERLAAVNFDALMRAVAAVYMEAFSQEELQQITDFYATPAGKALHQRMPAVMTQASTTGAVWGRRLVQQLTH